MTNSRCAARVSIANDLATLTILILCLTGGATHTWAGQPNSAKSKATTVNCGAGQSINHALRHAEPGETIFVQGTCHERVVITQPVTLDGGGSAVIDGGGGSQAVAAEFDGLVVIDGVTNVNLIGLTVQNVTANGIYRCPWRRRRLEKRHGSEQCPHGHRRH